MILIQYQKKRKFSQTPEPKGPKGPLRGKAQRKSQSRFVVQKHQASRLHYDFRLELPEKINEGMIVLKSWAVPKGVPQKAGVKHLAVQVEDHPVSYINFEGKIPPGNYGAGKVEIWDKGKFSLIAASDKFLKINLKGKKLTGRYVLTHFGSQKSQWLIFKMKDNGPPQ